MYSFFNRINFKKINWRYYLITFVLLIILYIIDRVAEMNVGLSIVIYILSHLIPFAIAFYLGIKNAYLNWLYPIAVAIFSSLVKPLVYWSFYAISLPHFIEQIVYGFFFIFLINLIVVFLGLRLGVSFNLFIKHIQEFVKYIRKKFKI